jgi:hypothetical protein
LKANRRGIEAEARSAGFGMAGVLAGPKPQLQAVRRNVMLKIAIAGVGVLLLLGAFFYFKAGKGESDDASASANSESVTVRGVDVDPSRLNEKDRIRLRTLREELVKVRTAICSIRQDCWLAESVARDAEADALKVETALEESRIRAQDIAVQARANAANYEVDRRILIQVGVKPNAKGLPYQVMQSDVAAMDYQEKSTKDNRTLPQLQAAARSKRAAHASIAARLEALMRQERDIEREMIQIANASRE